MISLLFALYSPFLFAEIWPFAHETINGRFDSYRNHLSRSFEEFFLEKLLKATADKSDSLVTRSRRSPT